MDVTALFENADSAEHALVNLQALGIFPSRYKIHALHIPDNTDNRGLFGFTAVTGVPGVTGITNNAGGEPPNREVRLLVTVTGDEAHRTQSSLISNHGRQVKMA
jgi:hypothetical protein